MVVRYESYGQEGFQDESERRPKKDLDKNPEKVFLPIGYGNIVNVSEIAGIFDAEDPEIEKILQDAAEKNLLVDGTKGRKPRSAIMVKGDKIFLSARKSNTLEAKQHGRRPKRKKSKP